MAYTLLILEVIVCYKEMLVSLFCIPDISSTNFSNKLLTAFAAVHCYSDKLCVYNTAPLYILEQHLYPLFCFVIALKHCFHLLFYHNLNTFTDLSSIFCSCQNFPKFLLLTNLCPSQCFIMLQLAQFHLAIIKALKKFFLVDSFLQVS